MSVVGAAPASGGAGGGVGGGGGAGGGQASVGDSNVAGHAGSVCADTELLPRLRALLCPAATSDPEKSWRPEGPGEGGDDGDIEEDGLYILSAVVVLLLLILTR